MRAFSCAWIFTSPPKFDLTAGRAVTDSRHQMEKGNMDLKRRARDRRYCRATPANDKGARLAGQSAPKGYFLIKRAQDTTTRPARGIHG